MVSGVLLSACTSNRSPRPTPAPPDAVGVLTRADILKAVPAWADVIASSEIDLDVVQALGRVPPGAEVDVFLGTWCGDSKREVSRLLRVLETLGSEIPFQLRLIGVDRDKEQPLQLLAGKDILYVPTFIVRRDGREVGRVVESASQTIERDLLGLLDGSLRGILTASRPELIEAP